MKMLLLLLLPSNDGTLDPQYRISRHQKSGAGKQHYRGRMRISAPCHTLRLITPDLDSTSLITKLCPNKLSKCLVKGAGTSLTTF